MTIYLPFYTYFLTWRRLLISLSLSLSCLIFLWIYLFIFCISTLDWCIYVFFRILLWVAIWFFVFKLLSFFFSFLFFSMIVKCYSIANKYSLLEYNVILLYIMDWIIWCLTFNYILMLLFLILFSISLKKKVISLSLSLSLSLSIYIYICMYIIYLFLQLYFRLMNHCIFYMRLFWVYTIW